jgi:hypothetical protein
MFYIREIKGKYRVYHDSLLLATFRNPEVAQEYLSKSEEKLRSYGINPPAQPTLYELS